MPASARSTPRHARHGALTTDVVALLLNPRAQCDAPDDVALTLRQRLAGCHTPRRDPLGEWTAAAALRLLDDLYAGRRRVA